jgi:hypothetical protein
MKVKQLLESTFKIKRTDNDNYSIFMGKEKVGEATIYQDQYGDGPAAHIGYFGILPNYRKQGFGLQCLQTVKNAIPKIVPGAEHVTIEPMSKVMLALSLKVFGKDIYIGDDINEYTAKEAMSILPTMAREESDGNLAGGNRVFVVFEIGKRAKPIKESLDANYYMTEGCGIYAMALSFLKPGGKIYIASNNDGEKWSKSIPFEVTHVIYNVDGKAYDATGITDAQKVAEQFHMQGNMSIKGPYEPMDFFKKFMGSNDTKPLYGTQADIKEAMALAQKQKINEYNLSPRQKQNALDQKATIVVTMPPQMFLDLTINSTEMGYLKDRLKSKKQYQKWIDSGHITVHPFIDVDEETGQVMNHEGRARAYAALLHGDKDYEVAIHLKPWARYYTMNDVPNVFTAQYNPSYKINFKDLISQGVIKVLNDNVQKQYQKESKLNETQPSAVYKSTIPDVYKALPKLGHGLTSLVLDKGDGTVLMFTRDKVKEEWLTRDWGIKIGDTVDVLHGLPHKKMEVREMPVYVIQMPKLYKLDSKNRAIMKKEIDNWHKVVMNSSGLNDEQRFQNQLNNFIDAYPNSILIPMLEFLGNYGTMANVDVAVRNTLQDKDGNIILVDPIVSKDLLKIMYGIR